MKALDIHIYLDIYLFMFVCNGYISLYLCSNSLFRIFSKT